MSSVNIYLDSAERNRERNVVRDSTTPSIQFIAVGVAL
jgi:hypothetical protein